MAPRLSEWMANQFAKLKGRPTGDAIPEASTLITESPRPGILGKISRANKDNKGHQQHCPAFPEQMTEDITHNISDNKLPAVGSVKVTFGVYTHPGVDPMGQEKENQDAWAVHSGLGGWPNLFLGVFDGHGQDGARVARFVASTLARELYKDPKLTEGNLSEAVTEQHLETNRLLWHAPHISVKFSGTTAVTVLIQPRGRLLIANVGDSRAVLGRVDLAGRTVTAEGLTNDHTPDMESEAERIKASGGRISPYAHEGVGIGPLRIWLADEDVPGLSMTRAFGDSVAARVGLRARPEIRQIVLTPEDRYLLLMSDGLSEFTENQELMEIVHKKVKEGCTALEVAKYLVEDARQKWKNADDGGACIDDCTAILAILEVPPLTASDVQATYATTPAKSRRFTPKPMKTGMARLTMAATAQAISRASRMVMD
eukprot:jgi/Botrbrau1/7689/Bobra.0159s0127.1